MLTASLLRELYPSAKDDMINAFVSGHDAVFTEFGIWGGPNRLHFFLAQVGHESGLKPIEENLNYSAERLRVVWPGRFPTVASTNGFAKNPKALANKVYNGRMGNVVGTDDGWNYRGRGLIQITGRDGYENTAAAANLPAGFDLVKKPDLATDAAQALRVACGFWKWKKLNELCDAGDFTKVTIRINGGTTGLKDRFEWLERVQGLVPWPIGSAPPAKEATLTIPQLKMIQLKLRELGLYAGSIDGVFGNGSRAGLKQFQADNGLPANGRLTPQTVAAFGL